MRLVYLLASMQACLPPAAADHLPDNLLAKGKPEKGLAGIYPDKTNYKELIRMYGPPQREKRYARNPGWVEYVWERPGGKLEVSFNRGPQGDETGDVYVEGTIPGLMGSTGRGLKLGDDLKALRRLYGNLFQLREHPAAGSYVFEADQVVEIEWKADDWKLAIGFNDRGVITNLKLITPEFR